MNVLWVAGAQLEAPGDVEAKRQRQQPVVNVPPQVAAELAHAPRVHTTGGA